MRVRLVQRSQPRARIAGVEHVSGDITKLEFAERAARGATVVYDCMNPAYHQWDELLLPIARGAVHGAAAAGARLVALDCLYMYGRPMGPLSERSPLAPCSRKGELRVQQSQLRLDAQRRGEVRVAIGRASDFFGADLPYSLFSDRFYQRALAGRAVECFGDPDMPHSYTYVEDVVSALALLGRDERALGRVWHLPTPPAESTRALFTRMGAALGIDVRAKRVSNYLLAAVGLFSPQLRELREMVYQWEAPFVIDDASFRETFGMQPTSLDQAVADTAAWARVRYGLAQAA